MRRREVIAASSMLLVAGCSSGTQTGDTDGTSTTTELTAEATETATGTPVEPDPTAAGSTLIKVGVHENYSGSVVVTGSCIDGELPVESGGTRRITRETANESCTYSVTVGDTVAIRNGSVGGTDRATIIVTADGTVRTRNVSG